MTTFIMDQVSLLLLSSGPKKTVVLLIALFMTPWVNLHSKVKNPVHSDTLAHISDHSGKSLYTMSLSEFKKGMKASGSLLTPAQETALVEEALNRQISYQEALRLKLDKLPIVEEQIRALLASAFIEHSLGQAIGNIRINDADAKSFYEKNPEVRLSSIFVAMRPGAEKTESDKAKEKIKAIVEQHLKKEGASFADVAQRFSEHPSSSIGGDLGFLTKDLLETQVYETALRLNINQLSPVLRTQFGYQIIKLTAKKDWDDANTQKVKQLMFEIEKNKLYQKELKSLKGSRYKVKIYPEKLQGGT